MNGTQFLHAQYRQDALRFVRHITELSQSGITKGIRLPSLWDWDPMHVACLLARESKFTGKPVSQLMS